MVQPFTLANVTVLDAEPAGTPRDDWTVAVAADGTIAYAGPSAEAPSSVGPEVDGSGRFLIPGLINAHAHLFSDGKPLSKALTGPRTASIAAWLLRTAPGNALLRRRTRTHAVTQLHSGVTTIRSVGDSAYEVVATRDAIDRGEYVGPRLIPSGPLMAITGGHGAPGIALICDTVEQARSNTRRNIEHGARAIKIAATAGVTDAIEVGYAGKPEMPEESMRAICEIAHAEGILVAAHAQSEAGVLAALRAGVDTIEHGSKMSDAVVELFLNNPSSLRGFSALIPTLQAAIPLVKLDQRVSGATDVVRANAELVLEEMVAGLHTALEAGILVGVGTDSAVSYVTHSNFWRELDMLQRYAALSPAHILHAATQVNAAILGIDDQVGSIATGKSADLVLLDSNPLGGFRALEQPAMVVARGHRIDHPAIDRIATIDEALDTL